MKANSITHNIGRILKKAREPLNVYTVLLGLEELGYEDASEGSIKVMLYHNESGYYIKHEGGTCSCCGKMDTRFSLSEKGLIGLATAERKVRPVAQSEWDEWGIKVKA